MLAAAPGVGYIHEPFNPGIAPGFLGAPLPAYYLHIHHGNEAEYASRIEDLIAFRYPLFQNISNVGSFAQLKMVLGDQRRMMLYNVRGSRPLIKDPIAFFSAEWMAARFGIDVLVMIRHPAAFCASLIARDWHFDFSNFTRQPALIARYLSSYADRIADYAANPRDIVGQGILLWNCIHTTIGEYQKSHPRWQFIRHENLSRYPQQGFSDLYEKFGLLMTDGARDVIRTASVGHKPTDWRRVLSPQQIVQIRTGTSAVAGMFYADDDW